MGTTPWNPPPAPRGGSLHTAAVMRMRKRLLTSEGWAKGWNWSLTPVSPSSHSTISPPGRHSRSGRLPAAPAPSPSRTQVYNDGVMKIQQISHISSSPTTPFPSLPDVGKHLSGFLSLHAAAAAAARWYRCYWCSRAGLTCTAPPVSYNLNSPFTRTAP